MKNRLLIIGLVLFSFTVMAQKGYKQTIPTDSVNGIETVYFNTVELVKGGSLTMQLLCTNTGGTSDGTAVLQASEDRVTWRTLNETTDFLIVFPNDTMTLAADTVGLWILPYNPFGFLRFAVTGTSGDSSIMTPIYRPKN